MAPSGERAAAGEIFASWGPLANLMPLGGKKKRAHVISSAFVKSNHIDDDAEEEDEEDEEAKALFQSNLDLSFLSVRYFRLASTDTRVLPGKRYAVSLPPFTHPVSTPTA